LPAVILNCFLQLASGISSLAVTWFWDETGAPMLSRTTAEKQMARVTKMRATGCIGYFIHFTPLNWVEKLLR
jgi:hypothetical protein